MKARITRTLSAGAVLVTAAGITIGSQGFGTAPVSASASSSSSPSSTPGTGSTAVSAPAVTPASVAPIPVPGSPSQFVYVAGDAATLVLDSAGGTLRLVTFAPHPGWVTVRLEQPNASELEVRLESASAEIRFAANLVDGVVVTELDGGDGLDGSVPGSSVPDNSAPNGSGPDNSSPSTSSPGNSSPGNSSPSTSSPGGDDNGGGDNSGSGSGGGDSSGSGSGGGGG